MQCDEKASMIKVEGEEEGLESQTLKHAIIQKKKSKKEGALIIK
jgi:hypothetical protein